MAILAYIDDPFDPIGTGRIGGGQQLLFDLGRYLVRDGFSVTFVLRRNAPNKPHRLELSPRCTIYRIPVGEPAELGTYPLAFMLDDLEHATEAILAREAPVDVVHSYHWTAGEVARRITATRELRHVHTVLSVGRPRLPAPGVFRTEAEAIRDRCEVALFRSRAELLVSCPAERAELLAFYPEAASAPLRLVPHGVDPYVFHPCNETADDYIRRATHRFQQGIGDVP